MSKKCDLLAVSVMSGNNVSHSNRKTRRKFYPNLKEMSFKSEVLGVDINIKLATSSLRTVNKYGNIDNFLVNYRFSKLTDVAKKYRGKIKSKLVKSGKLEEFEITKESKKLEVKAS